ncbi:MAG: amidohydrolase family protein [Myxococcales bacterium]|nr:amidohydrolase family protein [Myxococcales bacterium]
MEFDILFQRATVVDGSGHLPYVADVAVQKDRIAAIGKLTGATAARVVDADGLVLCPGFIDIHSHGDLVLFRDAAPDLFEPLIRQGITTFVGGNCGLGMAPLPDTENNDFIDAFMYAFTADRLRPYIKWSSMAEFMNFLDRKGVPINAGLLAPHGILRLSAVGPATRHATRDEIGRMCRWLDQALGEGALGLSTGLQYFPGSQSDTGELVDLARVVSRHGACFTSHLRSYSATLDQAVQEAVTVSQEAEVPVQISHLFWLPDFGPALNAAFRALIQVTSKVYERVKFPVPSDSAASRVLHNIDRLRRAGKARVHVDAMPTSAGFTHLIAFFPPWALEGKNIDEILGRLRDKKARRRMLRDIEKGDTFAWPHDRNDTWSMNFFKIMGWGSVSVMSVPSEKNRHLEGKNLIEIGKMWKMHPFDAACELLLQENGRVLVFETLTYPGDDLMETSVVTSMKDPNVSIVTDSILMGFGRPSHLFYDCYPKFFQRYVRETKVISLEAGVRKCTGLSADSLGIERRGYLKPGYFADLVLFDLKTIRTHSTFQEPRRNPDGIHLVAINGKIVVDGDRYDRNALAGSVLRH